MPIVEKHPVGHFCYVDIATNDFDAAKQFYESLFGWTTKEFDMQGGPGRYAHFLLNGQEVAGLGTQPEVMQSQGVPPMWSSYVHVESVEEIAAKAKELGGTIAMEPMQIFDAGHLVFVIDPSGAPIGFWQPLKDIGSTCKGEPGSFGWNELATRDVAQSETFYRDLLGWKFQRDEKSPHEYYQIMDTVNKTDFAIGGVLKMTEEWGETPPHWGVYFMVDDVDEKVAQAKELGGTICVEPFDIYVGRLAVVSDPQGANFYVMKMVMPEDC